MAVKALQGKVAIVTGSSNGIGRATARLFAKNGAKVTLTGRSTSALEESKNELLAEGTDADSILILAGDIMDINVQKRLVDTTVEKWGKLNILVNNAGAAGQDNGRFNGFETPIEDYEYTMNLNTKVALTMSQTAMPHLITSKGEIVNISSIAGLPFASTKWPYYCMAKAAMDQMTRSMAISYIGQGVRVNGINPGLIQSKFAEKMGASPEVAAAIYKSQSSDRNKVPIGRPGTPEDIAQGILFLCDRERSGFMVGQNLIIDGGTSLVLCIAATDYGDALKKE